MKKKVTEWKHKKIKKGDQSLKSKKEKEKKKMHKIHIKSIDRKKKTETLT